MPKPSNREDTEPKRSEQSGQERAYDRISVIGEEALSGPSDRSREPASSGSVKDANKPKRDETPNKDADEIDATSGGMKRSPKEDSA